MENYTIVNGELYHYGVLGMKWGKRHDRLRAAEDRIYSAKNRSAKKTAKKEYKQLKKEVREETTLSKSQKRTRLGASVAAGILTTPIGGIAVAALMTSHYRAKNDIERD